MTVLDAPAPRLGPAGPEPDDGSEWNPWLTRTTEALVAGIGLVSAVAIGAATVVAPLLVGVVVVVGVSMLVAFDRPRVATLTVVGLLYSNAAVVAVKFHGAPLLAGASLPLLLFLPLTYYLVVERRPLVGARFVRPLTALALAHVVATVLATPGGDQVTWLLTFVVEGLGLFFLLLNVIRTEAVLHAVLTVLVGVAGALGALSLFQQLTGTFTNDYLGFAQVNESIVELSAFDYAYLEESEFDNGQPRLAGSIGEKNFYGFSLAVVIPLAVFLALSDRRRLVRLASAGCALTMTAGMVLTFSRGAAVGFGGAVALLALAGVLPRRALVPLAIGASAILLLVPGYRDRISSLVNVGNAGDNRAASTVEADAAVQGRYSEMLSAVYVFADHPVVGVGPGQFRFHYLDYSTRLGFSGLHDEPREAHNLYLGLAAEVGALGLGSFLVFFGGLLRALYQRGRGAVGQDRALGAALLVSLVTFALSSLFLHMAFARYSWLLMALAAVYVELPRAGRDGAVELADRADRADPRS